MPYCVHIVRNKDKEERVYKCDLNWDDSSLFWWTDGNMGCDCNREMSWLRADGVSNNVVNNMEPECGDNKFSISKIILDDGTIINPKEQ